MGAGGRGKYVESIGGLNSYIELKEDEKGRLANVLHVEWKMLKWRMVGPCVAIAWYLISTLAMKCKVAP